MAGELKRERRPTHDAPTRARTRSSAESTPIRAIASARWFNAVDPSLREVIRSRAGWTAAPLFAVALVVVAFARSVWVRALLPFALALAGVALLLRSRQSAAARRTPRPRRGIALVSDHLAFESEGSRHALLFTDTPFGVTLIADRGRRRLIALLSSSAGTFSIGSVVDAASRRVLYKLLNAASTAAGDELGLDAIGPDGVPLVLAAEDFAALLEAIALRNPSCFDRFVLSDTRGVPITRDGDLLQVGDHCFELDAPLEWRSLVFEEAYGHANAFYQGTWVRQGGSELVLVSLLPWPAVGIGDTDLDGLDRGALRDLRLTQASTEAPPPPEQRVGIERLFMLPLRAALDRAPRASHQPNRAQA